MGDDRATGRLLFKGRVLLRARGGMDGVDTDVVEEHVPVTSSSWGMKLTGRSHLAVREEAGSGCQPERDGGARLCGFAGPACRGFVLGFASGGRSGLRAGCCGEEELLW